MSLLGRLGWRGLLIAVVIGLLLATLGTDGGSTQQAAPRVTGPQLRIDTASSVIGGNVAFVHVVTTGVTIGTPDPANPSATNHFHVFVDDAPPAPGAPIPVKTGVVHSVDNPVVVGGLTIGTHRLTVVLGDGLHRRTGDLSDSIVVVVTGPQLTASAAATAVEGDPYTVSFGVTQVRIAKPDGDTSGRTGHFDIFIDQGLPPLGTSVPADAEDVVHTAESQVPFTGLEAGLHTIWIVLVDGADKPFDPYVAAEVTVTITSP